MTLKEKHRRIEALSRRRHRRIEALSRRRHGGREWGEVIGLALLAVGFVGTFAWIGLYFAA